MPLSPRSGSASSFRGAVGADVSSRDGAAMRAKPEPAAALRPAEPLPFTLTPWPYLLGFTPFVIFPYGVLAGVSWAVLAFVFGLIPLMDAAVGEDNVNPTKAQQMRLRDDKRFRWLTWAWVPCQFACMAWAVQAVVVEGAFGDSTRDFVLAAMSLGTITGLGINVAHELVHKASAWEQSLGRLLLASVGYGHFYVEHLQGHHKRVSTPDDPASSTKGEVAWAFTVRSMVGTFVSAWGLEAARGRKKGFSQFDPVNNRVFQGVIHTLVLLALALSVIPEDARGDAAKFLFIQGLTADVLLEFINYLEHYGLRREIVEVNGVREVEQVTPFHSWNAGHRITNYFLFKLQRHSDHHATGGRRYQV
mmetsp:Transcript_14808/g.44621  ORF Transcript_14808/g.44621 Transcript_14808/m.44621 type:complete len:362 (-) Transcript_14808:603-1688(-)